MAILFSLIIIGLIKEFNYGEFLFLDHYVTRNQYRESIEFRYVYKAELLTLPNYSEAKIGDSIAKINELNLCIIHSPEEKDFSISHEHNDYPILKIKFSNLKIISNRNFLFYLMTTNKIDSNVGGSFDFEYFIFSIHRLWNIMIHTIKEDWKRSILTCIWITPIMLFYGGLFFTAWPNLGALYLYFFVTCILILFLIAIPIDLSDSLTIKLFKISIPIIFSLSMFIDYEFIKLFYNNSNVILSSMFFSLLFFGIGCLLSNGYIDYIKEKLVKIS